MLEQGSDRPPRRVRLFLALACVGLASLLGVVVAFALFAPEWFAVPGAVVQMTGQQVREEELTPGAPAAVSDGRQAAPAVPIAGGLTLPSRPSGPLLPGRRFNILLLGSDNDRKFAPEAVLTQSMILVSVDPNSHDVAMVSIPRDFWVPIPGYGNQKIDVAYEVGGVALARGTVERLFGIRIDYYAWVGLEGLVQVVDALGGIELTVLHPVLDDTYPDDLNTDDPYAYYRVYIPSGPQHLDGTTALEYVRSRHGDLQSDFGRSARQQQVLLAIKSEVEDPSMLPRLPQLVTSLQGSVRTDLAAPSIAQLALLSRNVSSDHIQRQILSAPRFASLGVSPDGSQQIVLPNWQAIRPEIARLLHLHASEIANDLAAQVWQESATVQVLNGTTEDGVASRLTEYLAWQGFRVVSPANAGRGAYADSQVIVHNTSSVATAQALAQLLHARVTNQPASDSSVAITVVLGRNHPQIPELNAT